MAVKIQVQVFWVVTV